MLPNRLQRRKQNAVTESQRNHNYWLILSFPTKICKQCPITFEFQTRNAEHQILRQPPQWSSLTTDLSGPEITTPHLEAWTLKEKNFSPQTTILSQAIEPCLILTTSRISRNTSHLLKNTMKSQTECSTGPKNQAEKQMKNSS